MKYKFKLSSLDCAGCALEIEKKLNENDIASKDKEIEDVINFIDNNNYKYANIRYYYYKGTLKKYINTSDLDLINILKGKYKYKVLNEKLPMYHFIID